MAASFIANCYGPQNQALNALAKEKGLKAGSWSPNVCSRVDKPALAGNTFPIKDQLNAAGARFCGQTKAWVFETRDLAIAFLRSL